MSPIVVLPTRRDHQGLTKAQRLAFVVLSICILSWAVTFLFSKASSSKKKTGCLVSHGTYAGSVYSKPSETIRDECLVESPWMRLARHSVRLPLSPAGGGDGDGGHEKVIDDWLFIDYHDRINVVVEAPGHSVDGVPQEGGHRSFMILSQTKYALDDGPSLAVVGGIIEPGEEASAAARREVKEELRVTCRDWRALGGRFRTDVNRGMGWVHPYLAMDCSYSSDEVTNDESNGIESGNPDEVLAVVGEVGGHDAEEQRVKIMTLSDVRTAVMDGKFVEVQWSNTVALAMLHLSSEEGH
eukprot:CAMPEP_0172575552 /NCGR_PEP_ID=MMETSP1067-20121228/137271_1 /TAXON_ID=265564 ORGANISM="Thalassiosira punctigera, Strain Tpunct2005C2" /NCGR_SAMPLE_ID=MMETSP1067 /ASSEMBLY_ACC=CAM_ASM_000444 /LENGTH=297 /DNA_ID=CAMNT_0013368203 /DNA_START=185 /DNA_END=1078 /DNA_ORIENTATION=+